MLTQCCSTENDEDKAVFNSASGVSSDYHQTVEALSVVQNLGKLSVVEKTSQGICVSPQKNQWWFMTSFFSKATHSSLDIPEISTPTHIDELFKATPRGDGALKRNSALDENFEYHKTAKVCDVQYTIYIMYMYVGKFQCISTFKQVNTVYFQGNLCHRNASCN